MIFYKYSMTINSNHNLKSIWDNSFYEEPPALAWTFKINFDNFMNINVMMKTESGTDEEATFIGTEHMKILGQAATTISVGERKVDQIDLHYGGLSFKHLTRVDNGGNFTITFNETSSYQITSILEKIYSISCNRKEYFHSTGSDFNTVPYRWDILHSMKNTCQNIISVQIINPQKGVVTEGPEDIFKQYKFYNCQLIGIEGFDFDYESTDTITRNATFVYDWMVFNTKYDDNGAY